VNVNALYLILHQNQELFPARFTNIFHYFQQFTSGAFLKKCGFVTVQTSCETVGKVQKWFFLIMHKVKSSSYEAQNQGF